MSERKVVINMKKVQISKELFFNLIRFHFAEAYEVEEDIKNELQQKLDSMVMREYYTKYKTAPTEQECEEAHKKYLDERGFPKSSKDNSSLRDIDGNVSHSR